MLVVTRTNKFWGIYNNFLVQRRIDKINSRMGFETGTSRKIKIYICIQNAFVMLITHHGANTEEESNARVNDLSYASILIYLLDMCRN